MKTTATKASIGLCMIVRNEEAVIERCLDSVVGLIDSWVICDTGSSDRTTELIEDALSGLPGKLHRIAWQDFGHARTQLMDHAHNATDYLLLLDADMTIKQRGALPALTEDAYLLRETGPLDFGVLRLVKANRRWWYEGSTHEYIATDGRFSQAEMDELVIEHHGDGSGRADKLIRDVGLLKRDLVRDPRNPRALFYLAQSYRDLGRSRLAIRTYRERVALGGWDEEVFYAQLQQGRLLAAEDLDAAIPVLLEGWERRPTRAEPLHALAAAHNSKGKFAAAHMFAGRGLEVSYPSDVLFVERWVYEWGLRLERARAAAGLGRNQEARDDLAKLLARPHLPGHVEKHVRASIDRLATRRRAAGAEGLRAPRLSALAPSTNLGEIKIDVKPAWPEFNPSIAPAGDGFRMIVRTANYAIERGVLHDDGVLLNVNYLVTLSGDLSVETIEPIVDRSSGAERYPSRVQGYEDCRLFEAEGRWYASATVCELNPSERREIALLALDGAQISSVRRLAGPDPHRHEKNWMPLVVGPALHFVYSCGPTRVLRCEPLSGRTHVARETEGPEIATGFRGGSQGVAVHGGHLFAVHEVNADEQALRYLHRLVLLDQRFELAAISPAFTFTTDRVEFCAGMARRGDELVLSFGVSDAAAGLAVLDVDEAVALLEPT